MLNRRPVRYRSKATGRFVAESYARENPDEAYAVGRGVPPALAAAAVAVLIGAAAAAATAYLRSRR